MIWLQLLIAWALCGVLGYGYTFSYWQRGYPTVAVQNKRDDRWRAAVTGLWGPIGLIMVICDGRTRHGVKFW